MLRRSPCYVILLLVLACGPEISSATFVVAPPKPVDHEVAVFLTRPPDCAYQELGTVSASEGAFSGGASTYVPAMKKRARQMGGDALIGYKMANATTGLVAVAPGILATTEGEVHSAVVVRFTKPDCVK